MTRGSLTEDNVVNELREQIEMLQKHIKELEGDDKTSVVSFFWKLFQNDPFVGYTNRKRTR